MRCKVRVKRKKGLAVCVGLVVWVGEGATQGRGAGKCCSPGLGRCGNSEDTLPFLCYELTEA